MEGVSNSTNKTSILLPIGSCYFLDFPEDREDCDYAQQPIFCYRCRFLGKFLSGEGQDDYEGAGHLMCLVILGVIAVMGVFGTLANLLIVAILKGRKSRKAFDIFLLTLACYDIICSVFPIVGAVGSVIYFQNWNRGQLPLYLYYIGTFTTLFGRSGSSYMTVLISFERYVVVAFPTKTLGWFNMRRTQILAVFSLIFSLTMAFPRYASVYVEDNEFGMNIDATRDLKYLLMSTSMERFFYVTLKGYFNQIDFWAPLPLLLIFNGLVYFHIYRYNSKKTILDVNQRNDIRAVRMFLPVVVVLFLCNITPIVLNYYLLIKGIYYRELGMGVGLSYVINSAVNLPIYYFGGTNFRKETKAVLISSFPCIAKCLGLTTDQSYHSNGSSNTDRF